MHRRAATLMIDTFVAILSRCSNHPYRMLVQVGRGHSGPEVRVTDSGPGVPVEHQERIFEKFGRVEGGNRTASRSTGLGLTFRKLAVEAHGGRIGLESQVGQGSTFWFTLPAPS